MAHEKRVQLEKNDHKDEDLDIISAAISSGLYTDTQLTEQLLTLLGAGHETTASVIGYAVPYLAIYPELQDWIYEEVRQCDGSYESFNKLIRIRALMVRYTTIS